MRCSKLLLLIIALLIPARVPAATPSSAQNRLVETQWKLASFGTTSAPSLVVEGAIVTIKFGADGKAGGSGGCNSYGGEYQARDDSLSLSKIISTKRACVEQATMEQERRYFEALETVGKFKLSDDKLTIYYNKGRGVLNFVKDSPPSSAEQGPYENLSNPVDMLASYFNAVNRREYRRAYGYWGTPPGKLEEFARGCAETASVQLIVQPPTLIDGAAGSLYMDILTALVARQRDGSQRIFAGCYVARKSNLRPPDIPKEAVWHIYKAKMKPVAGTAAIPQLLAQPCQD